MIRGIYMFVVIGATGSVGRDVVKLLLEAGDKVAAVTRDPAAAALPAGAHVVYGDPSRPGSLTALPDRVEAVLLSPRAVGGAGRAAAELLSLAAARGARRVVVLSAATVEHPAGERRFAEEFRAVEQAARGSGLEWTFLRCADFAANALAWAPQIRATGVVRGAYGGAATSPIHQRDIAEVAVRALVDPGHAGRAYVLTGPRSLDQRDKVRLIGEAIGRDLSFQELAPEQVRRAMLAQGLPEDVPDRLLGSLADYAHNPGPTTDTVEQLLGRPALTFAAWAADNTAAFTAPARS
ncbi:NAD(P)H-binding protein [Streptomyces sp. NPDC091292]|uniref:NAD(P)H-binding protein n=1 Tax=Streptomyces sp. NPDC091292 TaxID=3365991 RepID=UPI0037F3E33E